MVENAMTVETRIAVLVGSLRADSVNRQLAQRISEHAPAGVALDFVDNLAELPFYNEEIDGEQVPAPALLLRERVADADGVFVVTPEYNGTMPAALNNAIDWLSRPFGAGAISGKPLAVAGVTPTPYGGTWAHQDVQRSARIAGAAVIDDAIVSQTSIDFDVLSDPQLLERLLDLVDAIVAYKADESAA